MVSSRPPLTQVYGLQCKACGKSKASITMDLCPECERAVLLHFPIDYFKSTKKQDEEDFEELTAYKVLEALELASIDAPIQLAA